MKRGLVAIAVAACFTLLAQASWASYTNAYLCKITYFKYNDSQWGDYGYVYADYYTSPNCGGTFLGYHYYCSEGATIDYCTDDPTYLFTEDQILNLHTELNRAANNGTKASSWSTTCKGGLTNLCGKYVSFYHY